MPNPSMPGMVIDGGGGGRVLSFPGPLTSVIGGGAAENFFTGAMLATGKGAILCKPMGIVIRFQYNPEKTQDDMPVSWSEDPVQGGAGPLLSFQSRGSRIKSFEILLDAHSSPHPLQHVGADIDNMELLTIPFDKGGKPLVLPPAHGAGLFRMKQSASKAVVGIPPVVQIIYGGRIQKGVLRNLSVVEELHGTTLMSQALSLPTRARATFEFIIIDDLRMFVGYESLSKG